MVNTVIMDRIIAKLNGDSTLLTMLGVTTLDPANPPCFRSQRLSPSKIPSVTIRNAGTPTKPLPGIDHASLIAGSLLADENPTIELNAWVSSEGGVSPDGLSYPQTGEDADQIISRCDYLLIGDRVNPVQDTIQWNGISTSQQYEVETGYWHNLRRYTFSYYMITGWTPEHPT
jgi:hypothetical protein